ncbi:hypothetical protein N7535_003010 [Penicillium sp. DV-2018c]|nr:hypothetical protein N7461_001302 [Penicillium sp. DV-2018c]KAJ5576084.1 hypothetical protein N7535_003010 [Penicillium sp. DV-2018c]
MAELIWWYSTVKNQAIQWEIWEYIDPEVPEAFLSVPPTKPEKPTVSRHREDASTVLDLSNNELTSYIAWARDYEIQSQTFREYQPKER